MLIGSDCKTELIKVLDFLIVMKSCDYTNLTKVQVGA